MISIEECYKYARQCDELAESEVDDRDTIELRRLATVWRALATAAIDAMPRENLN